MPGNLLGRLLSRPEIISTVIGLSGVQGFRDEVIDTEEGLPEASASMTNSCNKSSIIELLQNYLLGWSWYKRYLKSF